MIVISCASSTTLLTPVSHPVSLMIMGPGDYRFGDYVRVGAPLAVLLSVTLVAVAVLVWGL
jgi:di/tricarboxylate transporter